MQQLFTSGDNESLLAELLRSGVRFLVVGGLAVSFHIPERQADDLDLLIEQTPDNAASLFRAMAALHLTPEFPYELISTPSERPQLLPFKTYHYADLVTTGKNIDFSAEWARSHEALICQHPVRIASRTLLIHMKHNSDREKDIRDVELLEAPLHPTCYGR